MKQYQKILKPTEVTVVADFREREVIDCLKRMNVKVNVQALKVGDFIASDRIAIERKDHSDFVGSIINGRVFEQAKALKETYSQPVIMIEGSSNRDISEDALKAAQATLIANYDVSLVNTKNPMDTARMIYWIAKKEQTDFNRGLVVKVGKKPKDRKKLQEFIVCGIPGVSTVTCKKLLKHFGSLDRIFSASEEELQKAGVGKALSKKVKELLSTRY